MTIRDRGFPASSLWLNVRPETAVTRSSHDHREGSSSRPRLDPLDSAVEDDNFPEPTPWVTTWPWRKWSRWQRTAVLTQVGVKTIVGAASIVSAIVLLASLGPQAYKAVYWRNVEYQRLAAFHAGFSLERLEQELGRPSVVNQLTAPAKGRQDVRQATHYRLNIFLRREHMVLAINDKPGNVILYSVLSCDPDFRPTFGTEGGTEVQLQSRPLSRAEVPLGELGSDETNEQRLISYGPPSTASSPDMLVEQSSYGQIANASRGRAYFVGVNGLCADLGTPAGDREYLGELDGAPEDLKTARGMIAANFYGESYGVTGTLTGLAGFTIEETDANPAVTVFVTPFGFDLPPGQLNRQGTRTF